MNITIEIKTDFDYQMNDVIAAFHYALQYGEEKMAEKKLIEYGKIIKDIRKNEPTILKL